MYFDSGEHPEEKIFSPFDTFIQIVDGTSEVTINKKAHLLTLGTGIVIPAQCSALF